MGERAADPLVLVFGDPLGDRVEFTLDHVDDKGRFVHGTIALRSSAAEVELGDRNGIETMALANLASDLRALLSEGGAMSFGDHDFHEILLLARDANGPSSVTASFPDADLWDVELPAMPDSLVERQIGVVLEAANRFGPLVGYCCGEPPRRWMPRS